MKNLKAAVNFARMQRKIDKEIAIQEINKPVPSLKHASFTEVSDYMIRVYGLNREKADLFVKKHWKPKM